ncbi:MAG: response regulator [Clostridia bacterium]|nr:response regulator [Clostridia bacterium]
MANIWIVEDDPQIALLIKMAVEKDGHTAFHMLDAVEMEKELRKSTPDLMLLDLMLRAKNGFEVLREWKDRKSTQQIPVIILSARAAEHDKVHGLDLGAEDYITKPFSVRELQARIRTALRRMPTEAEKLSWEI